MRKATILFFIATMPILFACTHTDGRQFVRPRADQFSLGNTTMAEVSAIYGVPQNQNSFADSSDAPKSATAFDFSRAPGSYVNQNYFYNEREAPIKGGTITERLLSFAFYNGTLVAYNFVSGFAADSSNFDEGKASQIVKGSSSREVVTQLLAGC